LITTLIQTFGFIECFSQTSNDYRQILDLIGNQTGLVLYKSPIGYINKDKLYLPDIDEFIREKGLDSVPKSVILELADKFDKSDKKDWSYLDFPNKVIISNRDTLISFRNECKRIDLTDKSEKKKLRKQISNFNYSDLKNIYFLSRPIFSSSGDYAVIQYDNCVNLMGGGGVILFKKINGKWIDYIRIYRWAC